MRSIPEPARHRLLLLKHLAYFVDLGALDRRAFDRPQPPNPTAGDVRHDEPSSVICSERGQDSTCLTRSRQQPQASPMRPEATVSPARFLAHW
jgi:hypothetical protein